jgi:hypothetical protein
MIRDDKVHDGTREHREGGGLAAGRGAC